MTELREKIAEIFRRYHQDSCYPNATNGECLIAADAILKLIEPRGELDADHLLIDLLFIAGTMDANFRWLEEAFSARLDEPLDIEMMKEARRRFKYWKDLQAKLYEQHQIETLQREKYEKSLPRGESELREALEQAIELLDDSARIPAKDHAHHERVKALGKEIGFGALMSVATLAWREWSEEQGYPVGSEFTSGHCRIVVEKAVARARKALAALGEGGAE